MIHVEPDPVIERIKHQMRVAAVNTVADIIKRRARHYHAEPARLDIVWPGLACAEPRKMIAAGEILFEQERMTPRRHFGFGGEIPALNAKAIVLLGRYRQRFGARQVEAFDHIQQIGRRA